MSWGGLFIMRGGRGNRWGPLNGGRPNSPRGPFIRGRLNPIGPGASWKPRRRFSGGGDPNFSGCFCSADPSAGLVSLINRRS